MLLLLLLGCTFCVSKAQSPWSWGVQPSIWVGRQVNSCSAGSSNEKQQQCEINSGICNPSLLPSPSLPPPPNPPGWKCTCLGLHFFALTVCLTVLLHLQVPKLRVSYYRQHTAPSIPSTGQNYGYDESKSGTLQPLDTPQRDATLGPAYYNVSHVSQLSTPHSTLVPVMIGVHLLGRDACHQKIQRGALWSAQVSEDTLPRYQQFDSITASNHITCRQGRTSSWGLHSAWETWTSMSNRLIFFAATASHYFHLL